MVPMGVPLFCKEEAERQEKIDTRIMFAIYAIILLIGLVDECCRRL